MNCIIVSSKSYNYHDMVLYTYSEEETFHYIKLPGIMKSSKRSSYFYFVGCVWSFTIINYSKKYLVPKESHCMAQPFGLQPRYEDMQFMKELLVPFSYFNDNMGIHLYSHLLEIIECWEKYTKNEKEFYINLTFIYLLKQCGVFDLASICHACNMEIIAPLESYFVFYKGNVCSNCFQSKIFKLKGMVYIPNRWLYVHLKSYDATEIYTNEYRNILQEYFKRSF